MEESNWVKSAARFVVVAIILGVVLFGGIYFLKNRNSNSNSSHKSGQVSKSNTSKTKTNGNSKSKTSKKSTQNSKTNGNGSASSQSPRKVAPAGVSDYWYIPVLGAAALGFMGYEYYLSKQALRRIDSNR